MKEWTNDNCSQRAARQSNERGISIVELIIVVAMIGIVTAFAVIKVATAQRSARLTNSTREFVAWLEKARTDSIRRHAMSPLQDMATIKILSANTYSVAIDQNGDGVLDQARVITTPSTHGATFAGIAVSTNIHYNWRGRPVDDTGNPLNLSFRLQDAEGNTSPINLTSTGDTSLGYSVNTSTVSIGGGSTTANVKTKTSVP
jgi:Tfp pilus assembly protein FimT